MPSWVSVIVGLALQGLMLAYFLGRMKAQQEGQRELIDAFKAFATSAIDRLSSRADASDAATTEAVKERASLSSRVRAIELSTDGLPRFREDFIAFSSTSQTTMVHVEKEVKRLANACEGMQRQIANLAFHGTGQIVKLPENKL